MTAFVLGFAVAMASHGAVAQARNEAGRTRPRPRPPLRIEVSPSPQLYRQCVDWHVIEHRATGDTVVPQTRCRWAPRR
jgi:hypothetical protein